MGIPTAANNNACHQQCFHESISGTTCVVLGQHIHILAGEALADNGGGIGGAGICFFDTAQGKPMGDPYTHSIEVREVALSQVGTLNDRHLIVVDANRDLYIIAVVRRSVAKLGSMVDSAVWHDTTPMLAAIVDEKLVGPSHTNWPARTVLRMTSWLNVALERDQMVMYGVLVRLLQHVHSAPGAKEYLYEHERLDPNDKCTPSVTSNHAQALVFAHNPVVWAN
jgi:hypothetical protein